MTIAGCDSTLARGEGGFIFTYINQWLLEVVAGEKFPRENERDNKLFHCQINTINEKVLIKPNFAGIHFKYISNHFGQFFLVFSGLNYPGT